MPKVVALFRRHGFANTTARMIEAETGLSSSSLANSFGDKDRLFQHALRHYRENASKMLHGVLAPPSVDAINRLFEAIASEQQSTGAIANSGCLMVNTAFELGATSDAVRSEVETYREMVRQWMETCLAADGIDDADRRSRHLLSVFWGALAQTRLEGSTAAAAPAADFAQQTIAMWSDARRG